MSAGAAPMAAAINWVLKDGIGQLGGVIFTAYSSTLLLTISLVSNRFDADSRGWWLFSCCLLELSTWLEVLSLFAPHHFLLYGSIANLGKIISGLAGSATRAGIRYGFVNAHNMSDLTAKEGAQVITSSLIGTAVGLLLSSMYPIHAVVATLATCVSISCCSLFSVYRALGEVAIPTINYQVNIKKKHNM